MSTVSRYVFNLITPSGGVNAFVKREFSSLEEARAEAVLTARDLMSAAASRGGGISDYSIEICNEARQTLLVVTFRELIP